MAEYERSDNSRQAILWRYHQKRKARIETEIIRPETKCCACCKETKPAAAFSAHGQSKDGLRPRCKICIAREHSAKQDQKGRSRRMTRGLMERLGIQVEAPPIEETPDGPIMRVPLGNDQFAVIDAADWPLVQHANWHYIDSGYAVTNGKVGGKDRLIYMHVLLLGGPSAQDVDHKDRQPLNNRRNNLRAATRGQNHANKMKVQGSKSASQYKGVRQLPSGRWDARIGKDGLQRHIGVFDTEKQAADAYDNAARALFGEFALVNSAM